jgi:threonine dehydrogenase-like Zn-dependent dehydrogenase
MRATVMYGAGDVRIENVPDPTIVEPTDAILRVVRASICGSDLWPYTSMAPSETGQSMGHEAIGIVEEIGADVRTVKRGDVVVMPFAISDGSCEFCQEGLQTACVHVGFFGNEGTNGAQAEALRIPYADGTLYPLPVGKDDELMPSLLTLSDVMGTGHHAAVVAKVAPGKKVAVVGDGAVGLCGVIAAKRLGAEQIIILGRHPDRIALAREFGATDVVSERGAEAIRRVKELTGGYGVHSVLECVGPRPGSRDRDRDRTPRRRRGTRRCPAALGDAGRRTVVLRQHHRRRRPCARARLHRRPSPGRARGPHRPRPRLRPCRRPRRGAGRLPGDERARGNQGDGDPLMKPAAALHSRTRIRPPASCCDHRGGGGSVRVGRPQRHGTGDTYDAVDAD